jgi:hypothetical protein
MSLPQVMRPESWAPRGVQLKLKAVHGRRSRLAKQMTEELRRVGWSDYLPLFRGRSDHLGSRSNHQPLFHGRSDHLGSRSDRQHLFCGWSDRLGSRSNRQSLFRVRSDRLGSRSDRQQRSVVKNPVEHGASIVVRVWEPLRKSHLVVRCLNR